MKWKGIKRETAPFVLTPEIAHVMGGEKGEDFKLFTNLCCKAFNLLRTCSNLFLTLFILVNSFFFFFQFVANSFFF
jgi:phosphatidylinositol-4,5-bisphosphate 3-kinase